MKSELYTPNRKFDSRLEIAAYNIAWYIHEAMCVDDGLVWTNSINFWARKYVSEFFFRHQT